MSKNTNKKTGKKKVPYIVIVAILVLLSLWLEEPEGEESTAGSVGSGSEFIADAENAEDYVEYYFRNDNLLEQHYEKHGVEMGFDSMEEYEEAACAVIYHPDVLTKTEKEDGDYVYYVEETNEFVILSQDGYIRTYFNPSAGIDYYNRQ